MNWKNNRPDDWEKLDEGGEYGADKMLRAVVKFIGGVFSEAKWKALSEGMEEE